MTSILHPKSKRRRPAWNKGKLTATKPLLRPVHVCSIQAKFSWSVARATWGYLAIVALRVDTWPRVCLGSNASSAASG